MIGRKKGEEAAGIASWGTIAQHFKQAHVEEGHCHIHLPGSLIAGAVWRVDFGIGEAQDRPAGGKTDVSHHNSLIYSQLQQYCASIIPVGTNP